MTGDNNQTEPQKSAAEARELLIQERAVSRGIAIGRVVCLYGENRQFFRVAIEAERVEKEIERLHRAYERSRKQLEKLIAPNPDVSSASVSAIFASQKLMIEDPSFIAQIEAEIRNNRTNSEWAIRKIADGFATRFKGFEDEHLRERYIDIFDLSERMINSLAGLKTPPMPFSRNVVIAAKELRPSTLVDLSSQGVVGVITENGGWTSHTFILARELNLPAVTGVRKLFRKVKTGDTVVVDGFAGRVIVSPSKETLAGISSNRRDHGMTSETKKASRPPTRTLDGQRVIVYANADTPSAFAEARSLGAEGIGLFRSEYLMGPNQKVPSVSSQIAAYSAIASAAGKGRVRIRTFDIEVERLIDERSARERNPALGLRAVRLGLTRPWLMKQQIRALLLASYGQPIDIIVPMVSGLSELRSFRAALADEQSSLHSKGKRTGEPQIGVMIEVPSAVFMIEQILAEADFICLGTNDLIQYLLAADRDNESVASWYRTVHPAVLRAVQMVIDQGAKASKPVIVCGEMAGSPYYVPVLIGLGATILSTNRNSIASVRNVISGIAFDEAKELCRDLVSASTVEEVEERLDAHIRANWIHLFPTGFLEQPASPLRTRTRL